MYQFGRKFMALALGALLLAALPWATARADNPSMLDNYNFEQPQLMQTHPFAVAHVVIQVDQGDPGRWHLVLNNVENMLEFMGQDKIQIVVVAYGPGLNMLLAGSPEAKRIQSLNVAGVEFDACHNTMLGMAKKLGHMPVLLPEAVIVPGGVIRIIQLEQHGFTYLKP